MLWSERKPGRLARCLSPNRDLPERRRREIARQLPGGDEQCLVRSRSAQASRMAENQCLGADPAAICGNEAMTCALAGAAFEKGFEPGRFEGHDRHIARMPGKGRKRLRLARMLGQGRRAEMIAQHQPHGHGIKKPRADMDPQRGLHQRSMPR